MEKRKKTLLIWNPTFLTPDNMLKIPLCVIRSVHEWQSFRAACIPGEVTDERWTLAGHVIDRTKTFRFPLKEPVNLKQNKIRICVEGAPFPAMSFHLPTTTTWGLNEVGMVTAIQWYFIILAGCVLPNYANMKQEAQSWLYVLFL